LVSYYGKDGKVVTSVSVPSPRDIFVALDGTVYVACSKINKIYTISVNYIVKLFAGSNAGFVNGNLPIATFNGPRGYKVY
jgi:hypothetical protein